MSKPSRGKSGSASGKGSAVQSLVRVERLIQIALLLPAATVVGWLIGMGLDRWLHQTWVSVVGLILGAAAGFVEVFRIVFALNKE
jgi:ATP synthase protein I